MRRQAQTIRLKIYLILGVVKIISSGSGCSQPDCDTVRTKATVRTCSLFSALSTGH